MDKERVKAITEQLEQGVRDVYTSGKWAEYLQTMSKFYNYSAGNCLLIMMQCPTATLVAGYRTWQKEFKRNVKKGEKAIRILAPITCKAKHTEIDEGGNEVEVEFKFLRFRDVPVFDISQTEGEPVDKLMVELTGDAGADLIDKLVKVAPVPVTFEDFDGRAYGYYSPSKNCIVVRNGIENRHKVKTLVHEIAHSILHCDDGEQEDADRRTKEVQAESVAYVVLNYLGIDTSEYSFGYVAGWSNGRDIKELQASIEVIRKTASDIIQKVA